MVLATNERPRLDGQHFHVVIIGGGINGVAIARECARAGRHTLLIEQNDFACGTTSRSTRIIHGGLRYLEHGELGLVRESLRERARLSQDNLHLIQPKQFLLLLNEKSKRSALQVRMGLWLYQLLGNKRKLASSGKMEFSRLERALDAGHQWTYFDYEDAQCEFPERLVADWMLEAEAAGATVRNHTEALAVDVSHGRVHGLLMRDLLSGRDERVNAGWVINSTGPWADRICQRSAIRRQKSMVGGMRGSHIVLPRFSGAPNSPVYSEAADGRPIFVIPWNEQILVGTTEIADSGDPAKVAPSAEEITYLIASASELFPKAKISAASVKYAFAGIRPLPYSEGGKASGITRRHLLHDHTSEGAKHMISVIGGKLTTAASLARDCARKIGLHPKEPQAMAMTAGPDLDPLLDEAVAEIARIGSISEESARRVLEWHGPRAADIARMALVSVELRAPICSHSSHIIAEAVQAYRSEHATTLGDVLLRRVPVALGPCWSESCSREAAVRIAAVLGWSDRIMGGNLEAFEIERSGFMQSGANYRTSVEAAAN